MTTTSRRKSLHNSVSEQYRRLSLVAVIVVGCAFWFVLTGCQTPSAKVEAPVAHSETVTLREGDVVRITFPGASNLDTTQPIRRDGKIALSLAGEVTAAGMSPSELEKEIIRLCGAQLVSKEVTVTLVTSSFPVFVTGAVVRPGKIMTDHPLSALEAVMEAGGFDQTKANQRAVVVIRQEQGHTKNYTLDLKSVLDGREREVFYLKPSDIVYVPEKFSWF